jgi:hypothetical protein
MHSSGYSHWHDAAYWGLLLVACVVFYWMNALTPFKEDDMLHSMVALDMTHIRSIGDLLHGYWNKFLFTDKEFSNQIDKYWKENRAKFYAIIDSVEQNRTRLKAAALHNFEQWKILDKQDSSLFNRSFDSYDDAVDHLKEWLSHRFDWISEQTGK